MGVFNHVAGGGEFYPHKIDQSCRFEADDSCSTYRTFTAPTDNDVATFSTWVKRVGLGVITTAAEVMFGMFSGADDYSLILFTTDDTIQIVDRVSDDDIARYATDSHVRDISSWYHIMVVLDTSEAASIDRCKMFVNGVQQTLTESTGYGSSDPVSLNTSGNRVDVGGWSHGSSYLKAILAETHWIDGQALTPADFGVIKSGIWVPIRYIGTYGNNGFYLDYSNSSDFGEDQSGNGNDFTDSGLATNDQMLDSPTNNYCTLNPLDVLDTNFLPTFVSNGNLNYLSSHNGTAECYGTMAATSGKWYFEAEINSGIVSAGGNRVGFWNVKAGGFVATYASDGVNEQGVYGDAWDNGDVIGCAIDIGSGTAEFFNNNVSQGSYSFTDRGSGEIQPFVGSTDTAIDYIVDFGQQGFTYTPPVGYKSICSANLPEPEILEGNKGFDVVTYTGTGAELAITDLEFSPDLVWVKSRSAATEHEITDTVRGATKELSSDSQNVEATTAQGLKSFDAKGFTLGTDTNSNDNTETYVAWNWKEDPKYGFDIVSYTGNETNRTIAHNLGVAPEMLFCKRRDTDESGWIGYHKDLATPTTGYVFLDRTSVQANHPDIWNSTEPTSSEFSLGTDTEANKNTRTYIAYLFASVEGYSKVFSYIGNGNADGPFVYCGFRPRFILIKSASGEYHWIIHDSERSVYNVTTHNLYPSINNAEDTGTNAFDILSNGFKLRTLQNGYNTVSHNMIGIAFAEHPFKYANAR